MAAEITDLTATPPPFAIGDLISITMSVSNTGTVNLSGTAVVNIRDEEGDSIKEFRHEITDLAPGEDTGFEDIWDSTGEEDGSYTIVAYALYPSTACAPRTAVVSTKVQVCLPVVVRRTW